MSKRPMAPMKAHGSDVVSLVAGLIFLGIAARWAIGGTDLLPGDGGWLIPLILIAAGVAGLLSARQRQPTADVDVDADADADAGQATDWNVTRDSDREGEQA